MDESPQKEVRPRFSERDKIEVVNEVITSRYKISSWESARKLLDSKEFVPLVKLETTYSSMYGGYYHTLDTTEWYFYYLVRLATGATPANKDVVGTAYSQLFAFIIALKDDLEIEGERELFSRQTLNHRLALYEARIDELSQLIRGRDGQIGKIYNRFGEIGNTLSEHSEKISLLDSSVNDLKQTVEDLDKSMEKRGEATNKVLGRLELFLQTYGDTLARAKREYDRIKETH
jgi:methyl-accepting chemotaxis protein